eukprot:3748747-Rhodomonas_salina.2
MRSHTLSHYRIPHQSQYLISHREEQNTGPAARLVGFDFASKPCCTRQTFCFSSQGTDAGLWHCQGGTKAKGVHGKVYGAGPLSPLSPTQSPLSPTRELLAVTAISLCDRRYGPTRVLCAVRYCNDGFQSGPV